MPKEKNTICPTCQTILSREQDDLVLAKHRRGRLIGGGLGVLGGILGASIGIYFAITAS